MRGSAQKKTPLNVIVCAYKKNLIGNDDNAKRNEFHIYLLHATKRIWWILQNLILFTHFNEWISVLSLFHRMYHVFMCFPRNFHNFPLGINNPNVLSFILTCRLKYKCCWYCCSKRYLSTHVDNFSINLRHPFLNNLYNRSQRSRKCALVYLCQRLCVCVQSSHKHQRAHVFSQNSLAIRSIPICLVCHLIREF